jgi:hypothetical protein
MATKKLSDLFGDTLEESPTAKTDTQAPAKPSGKRASRSPKTSKAKTKKQGPGRGVGGGRPAMRKRKEADLQRKELTLTIGQVDALLLLSRDLNRKRDKTAEGAEPITESALIRCALEALLKVKGQLSGDNEDELLESVMEALGL